MYGGSRAWMPGKDTTMTLTLDLTPEQEEMLKRAAAAHGLPVLEYVVRRVLGEPSSEDLTHMTPAEIPEYCEREGLYELFRDGPNSPEVARQSRERTQRRPWHAETDAR